MAYHLIKRLADVSIATLLLVLCTPLLVLISAVLWLWQGGPVFYRQQRVGLHGVPFTLFKFRTMVDAPPPRYPDRPVAKREDARITPFGRFLRRSALDELPQFLNILRGEMSLVGPRPLPEEDLAQQGWLNGLAGDERARRERWLTTRQQVLPGLTGRWQISAQPTEDFDNWIACDLAYLAHPTLLGDCCIVLCSPYAVLRGRRKLAPRELEAPAELPQ